MKKEKIFDKIYKKYLDSIYRFIFLKVNSKEVAQDISSEVFLKFWKILKKTKFFKENPGEEKEFRNLLYKIAHDLIVDHFRKETKVKIFPLNENLQEFSSIEKTDINIEKTDINSEIERIKKSLSLIGQKYQDVIIWHYLDGLSLKEIAEILGERQATVRVRLKRGLDELRKKIKNL